MAGASLHNVSTMPLRPGGVWVECVDFQTLSSVLGGGDPAVVDGVVPSPLSFHDDGRRAVRVTPSVAITGDGVSFDPGPLGVPVSFSWNMTRGGTRNMGVLTVRSPCIMVDDVDSLLGPLTTVLSPEDMAMTRTDARPDRDLLADIVRVN